MSHLRSTGAVAGLVSVGLMPWSAALAASEVDAPTDALQTIGEIDEE